MKEIECKDRSGRRNEMKEWADDKKPSTGGGPIGPFKYPDDETGWKYPSVPGGNNWWPR